MRKSRRAFIPSRLAGLEDRLVLSHFHPRGLSVVASGLYPRLQVINHRQQPIIAEINQSFDTFKGDFDQARATYFASVLNQDPMSPATSDATKAFRLYTTQRVSLLAQDLTSSFLQSYRGTARAPGQQNTVALVISSKIINPRVNDPTTGAPAGMLNSALLTSIPSAGASAPTATLYTMSQDNAIEAARVAVINAVNIIKNNDFGNQAKKPHF